MPDENIRNVLSPLFVLLRGQLRVLHFQIDLHVNVPEDSFLLLVH